MSLLIAGDIGGTKTLLRLVEVDAANFSADQPIPTLHENRYDSQAFPDLVPMVRGFLAEASQLLGSSVAPESACFAIAGPVVHQVSKLTNLGWTLESARLRRELGLRQTTLINDFAAVGYGILGLQDSDVLTLQAGKPEDKAPIAVIGAGTGLGQGFLIHHADGYHIYGSEGGHADFSPRSEQECELLLYLRDKHNISRVSVERVVSGQGIVAIYQFLRDHTGLPESPEVASLVKEWEHQMGQRHKTVDAAAAISTAALEQRDLLSEQTMRMFLSAYGAEAGNLALKLLPYGGLYIAGGIASKILPLMQTDTFLDAFTDKGRVASLMRQIPIKIVLNSKVGLIGAGLCAARCLHTPWD